MAYWHIGHPTRLTSKPVGLLSGCETELEGFLGEQQAVTVVFPLTRDQLITRTQIKSLCQTNNEDEQTSQSEYLAHAHARAGAERHETFATRMVGG